MSSHANMFGPQEEVVFCKVLVPWRDKGNRSFAWGLKFCNPVPLLCFFFILLSHASRIEYMILEHTRATVEMLGAMPYPQGQKLSKNTRILQLLLAEYFIIESKQEIPGLDRGLRRERCLIQIPNGGRREVICLPTPTYMCVLSCTYLCVLNHKNPSSLDKEMQLQKKS